MYTLSLYKRVYMQAKLRPLPLGPSPFHLPATSNCGRSKPAGKQEEVTKHGLPPRGMLLLTERQRSCVLISTLQPHPVCRASSLKFIIELATTPGAEKGRLMLLSEEQPHLQCLPRVIAI